MKPETGLKDAINPEPYPHRWSVKMTNLLERRRAQNRIAQRRFRQRQIQQAAAIQLRNAATDSPLELPCPEPTPEEVPSLGFHTSPTVPVAEWTEPADSLEATAFNTRLGDITFVDMDNFCDTNTDDMISTDLSMSSEKPGHQMLEAPVCGNSTPPFDNSTPRIQSHAVPSSIVPVMEEGPCSAATTGWMSPLHMAAQRGHNGIVRMLLRYHPLCDERDSDGVTPLMHATIGGYEDVVSSLLSHGARIDSVDCRNRTVLHWAVLHRRETLLKMLLAYCAGDHAVVDAYDNAGRTVLHTAIDTGFEAGVHILLQFGANIYSRIRKI